MPTYKQLPEIFAMTDGMIPFRMYLYAANVFGEGRFQKVEACPVLHDSSSIVVEHTSPTGPFSWDIRAGVVASRVVYWDTGFRIQSESQSFTEIPIYDFAEKGLIFQNICARSRTLYKVSNIQAAEIHRICRDIRNTIQNPSLSNIEIQVQPLSVADAHSVPAIPNHVLRALIRSAIADGKSCPISLVGFEDIEEIGVTSCFHLFEKEAIETWSSTNKTCPECRTACTFVVYSKKT